MIDSGHFPVTTLSADIVYVPALTLYLLYQDTVTDEQRMSRLQSELSRFCGAPIEFHSRSKVEAAAFRDISNYTGEPLAWNFWEVSRDEAYHAHRVELHSRPVRFNPGLIDARAEIFLNGLVQARIIDVAQFRANPQVHNSKRSDSPWLKSMLGPAEYVMLGSRAAQYIFYIRRHPRGFLWKVASAVFGMNPMSDEEIHKVISANIEDSITSVVIGPESRSLAKTINRQLRMKLGRKKFMHLMAAFR